MACPSTQKVSVDKAVASLLAKIALKKPLLDPTTKEVLEWANALDGTNVESLNGLGLIDIKRKNFSSAYGHFIEACRHGAEIHTYVNAAIAADRIGDLGEAKRLASLALNAEPDSAIARLCLFGLLEQEGKWDEQSDLIDGGLQITPDAPELIFARSEIKMRRGDWAGAWPDYEYRPTRRSVARHMDEYPEWQGEPLAGKTILVMREQGLGDEVMFSRCYPLLAASGARVLAFTYPDLARFTSRVSGVSAVLTNEALIPDFDYWVASGSLPFRLKDLIVGTIPPCNKIESCPVDARRLGSFVENGSNLRVGLRWAGNPDQPRERFRGVAYSDLAPLLDISGIDFYSLQDYPAAADSDLPNLRSHTMDVADMAAAISHLDVVISTDTMIAHLAASMGKSTVLLAGKPCDCRWGNESDRSPWYRTMKIFRQETMGDWSAPVQGAARWLGLDCEKTQRPEYRNRSYYSGNSVTSGLTRYGMMSWHSNDVYIGRSLSLYGEYSQEEADILRRFLKPGSVVIEAGANIGALTLPMADAVWGTDGMVYAFEPQAEYWELLRSNAADFTQVKAIKSGLGDAPSKTEMALIDLSRNTAPSWDGGLGKAEVPIVSIDAFCDDQEIERLDLIKIDTDGFEQAILDGARLSIQRFRPVIYIEYDKPGKYPNLVQWIDSRGYRIYQTEPKMFSPNNFAGNSVNVFGNLNSLMLLCIPTERHDLRIDTFGFSVQRMRIKN